MESFYLLTKDLGFGPSLIGILRKSAKNKYEFKYLFSGKQFPEYHFIIDGMPDPNKVYKGEEVYSSIISWFVPMPQTPEASFLESEFGEKISLDNQWEFLEKLYNLNKEHCRILQHPREKYFFYSELPERVNRYDRQLDS